MRQGKTLTGLFLYFIFFALLTLLYYVQAIDVRLLFILSVALVCLSLIFSAKIDLKFLFFVAFFVFILGRGLLGSIGYEEVFSVVWGRQYNLIRSNSLDATLSFWSFTLLVSYLAFFTFDSAAKKSSTTGGLVNKNFLKFSFRISYYCCLVLIPISSYNKIMAFISGGYAALYSGQTEYAFSFMRLITFIIPIMFSITLIVNEPVIKKRFLVIISLFLLASLIVGQRGAFGSWILVYVWYLTCYKNNKNSLLIIAFLGIICLPLFQFLEAYRSGLNSNNNMIFSFFNNQGMTFFIPFFFSLTGEPPVHTVLASLLPLGGVFQTLSLSQADSMTLSAFISSGLSKVYFEQGYGVGSSAFVEIYALAGNYFAIYLILLFSFFSVVQIVSKKAEVSNKYFYVFCLILPYLFLLPRGSISQITSQLIYSFFIMLFFYILYYFTPKKVAKYEYSTFN
jgi:hypothetical protein